MGSGEDNGIRGEDNGIRGEDNGIRGEDNGCLTPLSPIFQFYHAGHGSQKQD